MDKKQLEEKLSEIANWVYPSVCKDTSKEYLNTRHYKSDIMVEKPDLGPHIVNIKDSVSLNPCKWCNKVCNQKITISKRYQPRTTLNPGYYFWHYKCNTCQYSWDPKTKKLMPPPNQKSK